MRRRPLYRQFVSSYHCVALPPSSPSRRRRVIGARRASLSSQRLLVSLHGVGTVSGFWEVLSQLLAEHLLPSTPVFAGLHRRSTSSNFCTISNADNPIVRMYILSLLFVLMFLLLLASLSGLFRPKLCGLPLTASPTSVACVFQKNWYGGMVVCSR